MEESGLVRRLRPGLWAVDLAVSPFAVAQYLTAPYPAYVSFWSALAHHGLIEQMRESWTDERLDDFRDEVNRRFSKFEHEVDRRFDKVDHELHRINDRLDSLYRGLYQVGAGIIVTQL
jgi:hypothetical protein